MLNRFILVAAIALSGFLTTQAYAACSPYTYTFTNGTTADAAQVNSNFTTVMNCATTPLPVPTRQVFTSGSSATYTTPTGARQLRVRMVGGGGGGGSSSYNSQSGGNGGTTTFNGIGAAGGGGGGGASANPGSGGTGGTGTASFRTPGNSGSIGIQIISGTTTSYGGVGGGSALGGGGNQGTSAASNSGGGGGGALAAGFNGSSGAGGGGGEYVELIINSPAASYTYTIGSGGTAGVSGGYGGSGVIIVDEFY